LNRWRLLVLRDPDIGPHAETFDALLARTPPSGTVDYDLPQPKWWFLQHLVRSGYLLHGSNERAIEEFEPRPNFDAHNTNHVDAVFASDDAVWPLFFAVIKRPQSLINWCEHIPGASRYLFSIGSDPRDAASWTTGAVYVLPCETFEPTPDSRELTSLVAVRPRARLTIEPGDFPCKGQTRGHRRGESVRSVWLRNLFRLPSPR
jgi:hypothetical protein